MARKRRADDDDDDGSFAGDSDGNDTQTQTPGESQAGFNALGLMVKKFVRLALASEFSRQPIRRSDITQKVLTQGSRSFKPVFDMTQRVLREVFGMQLVELPVKEVVTVAQRRANQRTEKPSTSSGAWVVTSTLPHAYRSPTILPPSKIPSSTTEAAYVGLYTFIITLIMLCGGTIPEQKLERYLRRAGSDMYTPIDQTDRLLSRLDKEGYIVRIREMQANEQTVSYIVGPRGKVEVGAGGMAGLMKEVYGYGDTANGNGGDDGAEEFDKRLEKYLKLAHEGAAGKSNGQFASASQARRRPAASDDD